LQRSIKEKVRSISTRHQPLGSDENFGCFYF